MHAMMILGEALDCRPISRLRRAYRDRFGG